jgi:hypothetical protein
MPLSRIPILRHIRVITFFGVALQGLMAKLVEKYGSGACVEDARGAASGVCESSFGSENPAVADSATLLQVYQDRVFFARDSGHSGLEERLIPSDFWMYPRRNLAAAFLSGFLVPAAPQLPGDGSHLPREGVFAMPRDAKLGLILGLGLVLLITVIFFRHGSSQQDARPVPATMASANKRPIQLSPTSLNSTLPITSTNDGSVAPLSPTTAQRHGK